VEPVPGRGGIVVPPAGFLAGLRELCDGGRTLLVLDEVYTGFGRTGRWFAAEHEPVVPDILVVGKALGGGLPISAAIGTPAVMEAWPPSEGEAIHTSTFLGNPIVCTAALSHLERLQARGLVRRAARRGAALARRLAAWTRRYPIAGDARGLGLMQGVELMADRRTGKPAPEAAARIAAAALRRGVLLLTEGPDHNVLALTPPLTITTRQLRFALDVIEEELARLSP
jgi:4-aminobutyrate aminotransferase / (S)-3-amino-2-methylpropionate transaminase / 5-aminovalerate transaminase